MSSFNCEHCNAQCVDTEFGYITGCQHHPPDQRAAYRYLLQQLSAIGIMLGKPTPPADTQPAIARVPVP